MRRRAGILIEAVIGPSGIGVVIDETPAMGGRDIGLRGVIGPRLIGLYPLIAGFGVARFQAALDAGIGGIGLGGGKLNFVTAGSAWVTRIARATGTARIGRRARVARVAGATGRRAGIARAAGIAGILGRTRIARVARPTGRRAGIARTARIAGILGRARIARVARAHSRNDTIGRRTRVAGPARSTRIAGTTRTTWIAGAARATWATGTGAGITRSARIAGISGGAGIGGSAGIARVTRAARITRGENYFSAVRATRDRCWIFRLEGAGCGLDTACHGDAHTDDDRNDGA